MRVGSAQNDVMGIGAARPDRGHCLDHIGDPLVGRQQAEGEDGRTLGKGELGSHRNRITHRSVGDAMGNNADPRRIDAISPLQDVTAFFGHDNDGSRPFQQRIEHRPLRPVR